MTATTDELHAWSLKWTRAEILEFMERIATARVVDLSRHANRIASGARLDGFDAGVRRDLERRLEARRAQLGVAAPSGVV